MKESLVDLVSQRVEAKNVPGNSEGSLVCDKCIGTIRERGSSRAGGRRVKGSTTTTNIHELSKNNYLFVCGWKTKK